MALFVKERVVYSHNEHFTVRHVLLKGNNFDIGHHLGRMALRRYSNKIEINKEDPLRISCQNAYMKSHYMEHYDRMRGIAEAYGVGLCDQDCNDIMYQAASFGCSAVYFPNHTSANHAAMLSRNFDFPVGLANEPYIFEVYPDSGYPSMYLCCYDLASGVLDGINSEGLTVAIFADDESPLKYPVEPTGGRQVGLHELQIMRYLLDKCSNTEEAKETLLSLNQYYSIIPLHYLIGDRYGHSFVWEHSYTMNRHFIVEGNSKPQAVTNFLLHRYSQADPIPNDLDPFGMYQRYFSLQKGLNEGPIYTEQDMKRILANVSVSPQEAYLSRTLWHNLYNTSDGSMEIKFYAPEDPEKNGTNFTDYFRFQLNG
jgi:hypothetical protein